MASFVHDNGEAWMIDVLDGTIDNLGGVAWNQYVAWGTGSGRLESGTADLVTPAAEARVASTKTQPSANVAQHYGEITCATVGKTISEAGVFSASTGVNLLMYGDFTGLPLAVGDKLGLTFQMTLE